MGMVSFFLSASAILTAPRPTEPKGSKYFPSKKVLIIESKKETSA